MAKKNGTEPRGERRDSERQPEIVEVRISPGELLTTLARLDLEAALAYDEAAEMMPDERLRTELEGFAEEHRRHFDGLNALLEREGEASVAPPAAGAPVLAGILQLAGPLGVDVILVALLGNEQLTNSVFAKALAKPLPEEMRAFLVALHEEERHHLEWVERTLSRRPWEPSGSAQP